MMVSMENVTYMLKLKGHIQRLIGQSLKQTFDLDVSKGRAVEQTVGKAVKMKMYPGSKLWKARWIVVEESGGFCC